MTRAERACATAMALCSLLSGCFVFGKRSPERAPAGAIRDLAAVVQVTPEPLTNVPIQQAAEEYRRFLQRDVGDARLRAEAMRRLGDLQIEAEEAAGATDGAVATRTQLRDAIKLYEALLKDFPNYPQADAVMYQLARAYEAALQPDRSLATLSRLVGAYPASRWTVEAHFRRGELLFSGGRYAEAERAYAAVVDAGSESSFYDQGLYKRGWALFRLGRIDESVATLLKMLDRKLAPQGIVKTRAELSRPERELADDAMRAVAISLLEADGPESLHVLLAKHGEPSYAYMLYGALGDLYLEKDRQQDAAKAFEAFAKRVPDHRYAPSLQMRAIEAYQKGGFASLALAAKQAFAERYAFGSAFWSQRTVADAPEVAAQLKANLADLAQYYHAQAQSRKKAEDYNAAAHWYRALLDAFPDDAGAAETRFLLGDVLFDSARFEEAALEYEHVAYGYPLHAKSAQAGYAALLAYGKRETSLQGDAKTAWRRKSVDSALLFGQRFPSHREAGVVLTKAAEELFALREFERAIEAARQAQAHQPPLDSKRQRFAAVIVADSLFELQRYAEAESAYLAVQALLPLGDPERGAIVERIAAAIYKQGEAKQQAGDDNGAVEDFLRVVVRAPTASIRANAEFDAAALLIKGEQWERAIPVLERFRAAHPEHRLSATATRNLAVAYQHVGKEAAAAMELERVAQQPNETPDVRRAALWQAAELFRKTGSIMRAAGAYARYVDQYPAPLDAAMDARQHLVELAAATGDEVVRDKWLRDLVQADQSAGAARTDRSRYLAGRATLALVEPTVAEFQTIKLRQPLDKSLKAKRVAMDHALSGYSRALDYQSASVTTAATFGMAELYRQLAADVLASERPKNLSADALEQYEVLLEEQAFPLEEKAIELHQTNAQRTGDGLYDESIKKSFAALAKLAPARYAKTEIGEDYVSTLR